MPRPTQTPDALRERARALLAQAAAKEGRKKAVDRKAETHRKIVLGGFFLSLVGGDLSRMTPETRARLDKAILRPHDRRALGLPELPNPQATRENDERMTAVRAGGRPSSTC
jgi:hypothetical protein